MKNLSLALAVLIMIAGTSHAFAAQAPKHVGAGTKVAHTEKRSKRAPNKEVKRTANKTPRAKKIG